MINASLTSGTVPAGWKVATVVPLHKAGSVTNVTNYRPISILPVIAKVAESVVCQQLMSYLLSHSILSEAQHGFRPGRCTESAMLDTVEYLMGGLDSGMVGCLTTVDTSKAFDSVNHPQLLDKLGWYGIESHWFKDWLSGRVQNVKGGQNTTSITHGVIQGSLIGPILFLLMTNDLASHIDSKMVMYADDVQCLHLDKPDNLLTLQTSVENTMNDAKRWFAENSLKINPAKTDFVLIKHKQRRNIPDLEVQFDDVKIKPSTSVKVLGMMIDSDLSFDEHVSLVIRRSYATHRGIVETFKSVAKRS